MAGLEYHIGQRGYPGFTVSVTNPSGSVSREVIPAYALVSSTGAEIGGGSASTPTYTQPTNAAQAISGSATYRVGGSGYLAYATPTDLIGIRGSATKTVVVTNMYLRIQTTTGALQTLSLLKRSTANTGGAGAAAVAGVPVDGLQAAATASIDLYTAAPTTGTLAGTLMVDHVTSGTTTGVGGIIGLVAGAFQVSQSPTMIGDGRRGITLRGVNDALYLNYGGAALAGGATFTCLYGVEWYEY